MSYMYIVHVILIEPYTFHFTDSYSLKYMKSRTLNYVIAILYVDETLELRDSQFNPMYKEIGEMEYNLMQCNKIDMRHAFMLNPDTFTCISISNPYSLPILPNYKYCPELKAHIYRNPTWHEIQLLNHISNHRKNGCNCLNTC